MKYFQQIASYKDFGPLIAQLDSQPELWNENAWRRTAGNGAHQQMRDIWLRYGRVPEDVQIPHFAKWFPAYYKLPALRPLIFDAMRQVEATHLGGCLITRIPPGGRVGTHVDRGWHPEFYNCKMYFVLKSNPQCIFRVGDERVAMNVGDIWRVNNLVEHDVVNDGDSERMTLIVCTKQEI